MTGVLFHRLMEMTLNISMEAQTGDSKITDFVTTNIFIHFFKRAVILIRKRIDFTMPVRSEKRLSEARLKTDFSVSKEKT